MESAKKWDAVVQIHADGSKTVKPNPQKNFWLDSMITILSNLKKTLPPICIDNCNGELAGSFREWQKQNREIDSVISMLRGHNN